MTRPLRLFRLQSPRVPLALRPESLEGDSSPPNAENSPMELWPAIDIRGGRCVRLRQGDYDQETGVADDPVQMAAHWVAQGARRLHLVDLDGARSGSMENSPVVEAILQTVEVPCQLGGGVRSQQVIEHWLGLGVARLVVGTQALKAPQWFEQMARQFPGRLVLGLDARDGRVATGGWLETSDVDALELARRYQHLPLAAIVYTDIARDGMMQGPNLAGVGRLVQGSELPVIASGGVSTVEDIRRLAQLGAAGCIVGRALYERAFTLPDALAAAGE